MVATLTAKVMAGIMADMTRRMARPISRDSVFAAVNFSASKR